MRNVESTAVINNFIVLLKNLLRIKQIIAEIIKQKAVAQSPKIDRRIYRAVGADAEGKLASFQSWFASYRLFGLSVLQGQNNIAPKKRASNTPQNFEDVSKRQSNRARRTGDIKLFRVDISQQFAHILRTIYKALCKHQKVKGDNKR